VGLTYDSANFNFQTLDSTTASTLLVPLSNDSQGRNVWAGFVQVNIPIFEDVNKLPLLQKLELEASWRHDQYSDVGGTSNPKVALNWQPIDFLTFRGAWGNSFRAPAFGELSILANNAIAIQNSPDSPNSPISFQCIGAGADAGSGAGRMLSPGAGLIGYSGGCGAASQPRGISFNGGWGSPKAAGWRDLYANPAGGVKLKPETATNWAAGVEFAPTTFLTGLDIQATWFSVKINGLLNSFGNPQTSSLSDGNRGFAYIVPTDLSYLHTGADLQCHNNNTPGNVNVAIGLATAGCPEFETMVLGIMANPRNTVAADQLTNILWLNDGGTFNIGWTKVQGIDWNWSYDVDLGEIGAINFGQVGTYYLHNTTLSVPGTTPDDLLHTTISDGVESYTGVESQPRLRYRARLGWSNGPWSATAFMDYRSHFFHTQNAPPNVNLQCQPGNNLMPANPPGGTGNAVANCAITGYQNLEPPQYNFDLSFGYDTGDDPANNYLKHIGIQVIVGNVLGTQPPFEYRAGTGAGNPSAVDASQPGAGNLEGRTFSLILTKTW
jgi:hypothetical protein